MTNSPKPEPRDLTADQQFWQLWRQGKRPDLVAFLAARAGLDSTAVAAVVAIDQYERWMAGDRAPADWYLTLLPDDPSRDQAACDVVYGEFLLREQLGERPDVQAYLAQFPSLNGPLSRQFALHSALADDAAVRAGPDPPVPTRHGHLLATRIGPAAPVVPGYEVLEPIGKGGMGVVYRARQVSLHRVVALKVFDPPPGADPSLLDRMRREAQVTARLSHPNIVTVHDAGLAGSSFYLAMEYVEGTDLHRLVEQQGPLPVATACEYARQAALGLQHAHEKGLVHRDIKPSNLIVAGAGDGAGVLKVLDLGLARLTPMATAATEHAPITQVGAFMGTPDFVAPEQAADPRAADARSDLYSLGCTLYYMLTGQAPFGGATTLAKLVQHHLQDAAPVEELRPGVPAGVVAIVRRLMAKRPEDRFQSAGELLQALAAAPAPQPGAARPVRRAGLERRLAGHSDRVRGVTFAPNGRWLASAGLDGTACLWPLAGDGEPVRIDVQASGVTCLAFTADGAALLCGAEDGSLSCWDVTRRSARWRAPGHTDSVNALAVSRAGDVALTGGHDGSLRLWDVGTGQLARSWMAHGGPVWGVGLTPDGRVAMSGGQDRGLRLWDATRGESLALLPEQPMLVTCLALSPDGRLALTGGIDGAVHVWELAGPRELGTLDGHEGRVTAVTFSPDGARAASASRDQTVRLWDVGTRTPREVLREHSRWVTCVAWSADGDRLASGGIDRVVCLWGV
ncbi:MAG: serine/threonine-protein kinase [Gemmataceae bacterium]